MVSKRYGLFILVTVLSMGLCSCRQNTEKRSQKDLTLFVAASLTDVMTEITQQYTAETGVVVKLNAASSGTLALQLSQGAPADLYFSASKKWMDYVAVEMVIARETRVTPAKNKLVLVYSTMDSVASLSHFDDLKRDRVERISMGDPAHVPAGKYAMSALKSLGIYESIESKLLYTKDVRSALMVVELGECDYGVVYKTDAMKSDKVAIALDFPESSHAPIVYSGAVCEATADRALAKSLLDYIGGESTQVIWEKYGFEI